MLDWGSLGFHICGTASNGQEALEMAERMHPDLIICDLKMPVMDGIDLIRTAKDRSMNCEFLVISNYEDFNIWVLSPCVRFLSTGMPNSWRLFQPQI